MKLDVVGASEAAQILGVEVPRISRWRDKGRMPPTVAELKATPVWRRVDIEKLRDEGKWSGRRPPRQRILGLAEVAELLDVDKSQVGRWRREGKFPEPVLDKRDNGDPFRPGGGLSATPLWGESEIQSLARARSERAQRLAQARRQEGVDPM